MSHLQVAVMPADDIGKEITAPSVDLVREAAHKWSVVFS
jgi:isocitrate/isopropylmalate dehydrogenase